MTEEQLAKVRAHTAQLTQYRKSIQLCTIPGSEIHHISSLDKYLVDVLQQLQKLLSDNLAQQQAPKADEVK